MKKQMDKDFKVMIMIAIGTLIVGGVVVALSLIYPCLKVH